MRKQLVIKIDIEDNSPEQENWLVDMDALTFTIQDRLEVPDDVTVHSIELSQDSDSCQSAGQQNENLNLKGEMNNE
ncbi:hypothetical protein [Brevibacillus reuszeri]|uniref:hypothetical protein n=1 Tax=Brevibacillus reuszeri TaxID=54915 RepID=UPI000CCC2EC0|nr:hypothetical protein [Brevibacillus reuszeri]